MPPRQSKRGRGNRASLPFCSENPILASVSTSASLSASISASLSASISSSLPTSTSASVSASSPIPDLGDLTSPEETGTQNRSWHADIWKHYHIYDGREFTDGIARAVCKYCGGGPTIAPSKTDTSNFKRHYESCKYRPSDDKDEFVQTRDGKLVHKVDQFFYKEIVCLSIIKHSYPLSFAEHSGTRKVHTYLNDTCKPFSRNTAKKYIMKIHEREKSRLKEFMNTISGRICLTSDMWTSSADQGFMSLTAHFVDDDWNLHCKIINFHHVDPPHSALALHDAVLRLLKDWGIHRKVLTITLDNARSNDNMQSMLFDSLNIYSSIPCGGKYFHVRCSAHILNLIVEEGLKVIDEGLRKVKKMVGFVGSSERRTLQFKEIALSLGIDCSRNLRLNCPTRWNSTYTMLDRALTYRLAFSSGKMIMIDSSFPEIPSNGEWDRIEKICELLKPFDALTTLMSGRKYPTSNLYFQCVWKVELLLLKYAACEDTFLMEMASRMKRKFDKYWSSYSLILSFAIMLDPRYKFQLIQHCFEKLDYGSAHLKSTHVKEEFQKLFEEYDIGTHEGNSRDHVMGSKDFEGFGSIVEEHARKSELELYFEEVGENHNLDLDVLVWWKKNAIKYPSLSKMARDIFAIPITTVASESAFSMGSRVITRWRSSLGKETAEALLTTRSWLYGLDIEEGPNDDLEEELEIQISRLNMANNDYEVEDEVLG